MWNSYVVFLPSKNRTSHPRVMVCGRRDFCKPSHWELTGSRNIVLKFQELKEMEKTEEVVVVAETDVETEEKSEASKKKAKTRLYFSEIPKEVRVSEFKSALRWV